MEDAHMLRPMLDTGRKLRKRGKIMTSDTRDIHIHLTAQPGTTVHVTVAGDNISVTSDDARLKSSSPDAAGATDEVLEAAIRRLESSGLSPHVREAADGLLAMGYKLRLAKTSDPGKRPENYLRIMDPKYTTHGMGYLTPGHFAFSRRIDRNALARLPGAELLSGQVKFSHVQSAQLGLDAARAIKN
jgi:hypothetical protein